METKRLYRSNKNRVFAGVCGGIGDYFNIDPVIVRLLWVIATFCSFGAGLLGYVIAWVIIPDYVPRERAEYAERPEQAAREAGYEEQPEQPKKGYGCLYAIGILVLFSIAVSVVSSVFGFFGFSMMSGAREIFDWDDWGGMHWYGWVNSLTLLGWGLAAVVTIALVIVVIMYNKKK